MYYTFGQAAVRFVNNLNGMPYLEQEKRVSQQNLVKIIYGYFDKKNLKNPVESLMLVSAIAGSDCTDSYHRLNHEKMFEAFFQETDYIGDLYLSSSRSASANTNAITQVDYNAYRRLLTVAWRNSFKQLKDLSISKVSIDDMRRLCEIKGYTDRNRIETNETIQKRYLHTELFFKLMNQFDTMQILEPDLRKYAYVYSDVFKVFIRDM